MGEPLSLGLGEVASPIGRLVFACDGERLLHLDFADEPGRAVRHLGRRFPHARIAEGEDRLGVGDALERYFSGDLAALDSLAVEPGGTAFERSVWLTLREIPVGSTMSYGALARRLGRPKAVRAVGGANGRNPISLVLPCHRVIGADGRLTGYGGGLHRKTWLLQHEGALI